MTVTNNVPDLTINDVRQFAGNAFGIANGWQIWLGSETDNAVFLGGADGGAFSFKSEFEMLMMDKVKEPKAFAIECLKGAEGVRLSQPMQQPSGAILHGDVETVANAVEEVLDTVASAAKTQAARARGAFVCSTAVALSPSHDSQTPAVARHVRRWGVDQEEER